MPRRALVLLVSLLLAACGSGASDSNRADTTYGASVDATDAMPVPAVAAEDSLYRGHEVTIDGRITAVRASGCEVKLATEAALFIVTAPRPKGAPRAKRGSAHRGGSGSQAAPRTDAGGCAWQLSSDASGVAVAAGTLRTAGDTLRLMANGVQVTPVRISSPDS